MGRARNQEQRLPTGSMWIQILSFALPIAAASILQQLFNSTDSAVVGRFAGSQALAAVGSTSMVVNLCITILTGLSVGANVRVAFAVGSGDEEKIRKGVDTAMIMAVVSGILLTAIGEIFAEPLLKIMNTPEDIIDLAVQYVRIYFLGVIFLTIYNFEAALLRASGDSKKPLYCLLFSGILNLGFNLLFVVGFRMGVVGVALGTLLADIANAALLFCFLVRGNEILRFDMRRIRFDPASCSAILTVGIPAAVQGMMFNIANLIIQTGMNGLGSAVVAGSTIGLNAEIFTYYLITGFSQAAVTFCGQNLGAGNLKRCRQVARVSWGLGAFFTILLSGAFFILAVPFSGIFSGDAQVVQIAAQRIRVVILFEVFNMSLEVFSGALRGLGHSSLPAGISAVCICLSRIIWMLFVFPVHHTFRWLMMIYPISWILDTIFIFAAYKIVMNRLEKKRIAAYR